MSETALRITIVLLFAIIVATNLGGLVIHAGRFAGWW